MLILFRECANAKVVGVADGAGVAEDPDGLDRDELARLVREALPIVAFDAAKRNASRHSATKEKPKRAASQRQNGSRRQSSKDSGHRRRRQSAMEVRSSPPTGNRGVHQ